MSITAKIQENTAQTGKLGEMHVLPGSEWILIQGNDLYHAGFFDKTHYLRPIDSIKQAEYDPNYDGQGPMILFHYVDRGRPFRVNVQAVQTLYDSAGVATQVNGGADGFSTWDLFVWLVAQITKQPL